MKKLTILFAAVFVAVCLAGPAAAYWINDDATGGDCPQIGTWDGATKTCTLNTDITETIHMRDSGISLDGAGHTLTCSTYNTGIAMNWYDHTTDVDIRNVTIEHCRHGIAVAMAADIVIENSIFRNDAYAVEIYKGVAGIIIRDNLFEDCPEGIYVQQSGDQPNYIVNNVFRGSYEAVMSWISSNGNVYTDNLFEDGGVGLWFYTSSSNGLVRGNTFRNNYYGMSMANGSNDNLVYNNNFIYNGWPLVVVRATDILSLDAPVGGNYYDIFDEPAEGCNDQNGDGFCDQPFMLSSGAYDYLPWTQQDGWNVIAADVDVNPKTLNTRSKGGANSVTVYIEIPDADVSAIETESVIMSTAQGSVTAQARPTAVGDHDGDGVADLMVKFDRQDVIGIAGAGQLDITVKGWVDGKRFKGTDTIQVK